MGSALHVAPFMLIPTHLVLILLMRAQLPGTMIVLAASQRAA